MFGRTSDTHSERENCERKLNEQERLLVYVPSKHEEGERAEDECLQWPIRDARRLPTRVEHREEDDQSNEDENVRMSGRNIRQHGVMVGLILNFRRCR